jgi:hypothetical protein
MGQDEEAASLPGDVLVMVNILGRLAPRWLAVSRSVCKAWQAMIDDRRLLRTELLPLRLEGIFMYFSFHKFPEFFSRPGAPIAGELDFLPTANEYIEDDQCDVQDHCNGLLLLQDAQVGNPDCFYVVNPATRRWDSLPTLDIGVHCWSDMYLVYDPMVSPHYEVFMIPHKDGGEKWAPATVILNVLSSRTRSWEPRSFDREGDALGTTAEMRARRIEHISRWFGEQRRRAVYR